MYRLSDYKYITHLTKVQYEKQKSSKKLTFILTMVQVGVKIQVVQMFEQSERRIIWHSIMTN